MITKTSTLKLATTSQATALPHLDSPTLVTSISHSKLWHVWYHHLEVNLWHKVQRLNMGYGHNKRFWYEHQVRMLHCKGLPLSLVESTFQQVMSSRHHYYTVLGPEKLNTVKEKVQSHVWQMSTMEFGWRTYAASERHAKHWGRGK